MINKERFEELYYGKGVYVKANSEFEAQLFIFLAKNLGYDWGHGDTFWWDYEDESVCCLYDGNIIAEEWVGVNEEGEEEDETLVEFDFEDILIDDAKRHNKILELEDKIEKLCLFNDVILGFLKGKVI